MSAFTAHGPTAARPARWADLTGRTLMAVTGISTLIPFVNGISRVANAPEAYMLTEFWRTTAYLVFAGLWGLLALAPRRQRGIWELLLTIMPAVAAATAGVDPRNAGVASGLINMCRQLGAALGLAALVTVAAGVTSHSHATSASAVVDGYRAAFYAIAAACAATAALALMLRPAMAPGPREQDTQAADGVGSIRSTV